MPRRTPSRSQVSLRALADEFDEIDPLDKEEKGKEEPLPTGHGLKLDLSWRPNLNPTQQKAYESRALFQLLYGERGSGKTQVAAHKAVRHCVMNKNALAFVMVREIGQATEGGAWSKLQREILPQWRNGNYDRITKKRLDAGCGIQFTEPKLDPTDKKPFLWISNRFGGWSQIKLISLFVPGQVEDKAKGKEPSFILFDEAQTTESDEYFSKVSQQLGRAQDIPDDEQQVVYACNPKGPSHWIYKVFFCHAIDEKGEPAPVAIDRRTGHPIDPETEKPITDFAIFHVPVLENAHNLPARYLDRIQIACKNDKVEHARMILGEWVDRPEGDAIFAEHWKGDDIHVRGDALRGHGLMPLTEHVAKIEGRPLFILGWDPGAAHTSITFMQYVITPQKLLWLVIDEFCNVGRYTPYRVLVPRVINRLIYWEYSASELSGNKVEFHYMHISDASAFNQFRAKDGSFDAQDIEDISKEYVEKNGLPERFIFKMRACPKEPHSVEARVRIAADSLAEESLILSATCPKVKEMFLNLHGKKDDRMKPVRSKHLHPFDSLTYPMFYFNSGAGKPVIRTRKQELPAEIYTV
jgi:hypothetical protein